MSGRDAMAACPHGCNAAVNAETTSQFRHWVQCYCGARGPVGSSEREAVKLWNTRTDPHHTQALAAGYASVGEWVAAKDAEIGGLKASVSILNEQSENLWLEICALRQEIARYRDALDPNKTKRAYIGEFSFNVPDFDECGGRTYRRIDVPWPTIREIMAAISARAELGETQ